jgi:hypothetical protein
MKADPGRVIPALASGGLTSYLPAMDDVRPLPTFLGWIDALDHAEADVAAGRTVDDADILPDLQPKPNRR